MKNHLFLFLLLTGGLFAFTGFPLSRPTNTSSVPVERHSVEFSAAGLRLATDEVLSYKSLQLIPIKADESYLQMHASLGHYLTLKEATEKNIVAITERIGDDIVQTEGETVNTLFIENTGTDTVFVMAGELVKGGRQDRVIAMDFLLEPKSGKVDLSVFCVEHGRWSYGDMMGVNAIQNVQDGNDLEKAYLFSTEGKVISNSVRKTAMKEKDQTQVWDKVEEVTLENGAGSSTGTYFALDSSAQYVTSTNDYFEFFRNKFSGTSDVVGVLVMSGNRIIGCDIFCKPDLFSREFSGLLNAYVAEAITAPGAETVDMEKATKFFEKSIEEYSGNSEKTKDQKFIHLGKIVHFSGFDS